MMKKMAGKMSARNCNQQINCDLYCLIAGVYTEANLHLCVSVYVWQNAKRLPAISLGECFWECKFWDETAESTERTHVEGTGTKQIHLFRLLCCSEPQSQTCFGALSLKNVKNLLKNWTCSKIIWWTDLIKLLKSPSDQLNQTLLLKMAQKA